MLDLLPDASIDISIPAIEFLDQIASVASGSGILQVEKYYEADGLSKMDILNLCPIGITMHEGLLGQLIHAPDDNKRIRIEVRALRWSEDENPTYESYVEAMQFIFRDLLTAYNKKHGTRYRITIEAKDACEPVLSPKARKAFDKFIFLVNKGGLHPLDWQRFYRFSRICHALHVKTNQDDIFRLLVHSGFPEVHARELASVFGHLRDFQRL